MTPRVGLKDHGACVGSHGRGEVEIGHRAQDVTTLGPFGGDHQGPDMRAGHGVVRASTAQRHRYSSDRASQVVVTRHLQGVVAAHGDDVPLAKEGSGARGSSLCAYRFFASSATSCDPPNPAALPDVREAAVVRQDPPLGLSPSKPLGPRLG